MSQPVLLTGLPRLYHDPAHPFIQAIQAAGGGCLISAGALHDARKGWMTLPLTAWSLNPALDSAGFVAMAIHGGYRWTVESYVERVVRSFCPAEEDENEPLRAGMPCPFRWWAAMDYCCEREIAKDRAEVVRRMQLTVDSYAETLAVCESWRQEGVTGLPDPLPTLQGRLPGDYVTCARELAQAIDGAHACSCPAGQPECDAEHHRERSGLPELVGLGSVCRRPPGGPDGLLAVLSRLDAELPSHVKLHLFGVHSSALMSIVQDYGHRVASYDSQAWGMHARRAAQAKRRALGVHIPDDRAGKVQALEAFVARQDHTPAQLAMTWGRS